MLFFVFFPLFLCAYEFSRLWVRTGTGWCMEKHSSALRMEAYATHIHAYKRQVTLLAVSLICEARFPRNRLYLLMRMIWCFFSSFNRWCAAVVFFALPFAHHTKQHDEWLSSQLPRAKYCHCRHFLPFSAQPQNGSYYCVRLLPYGLPPVYCPRRWCFANWINAICVSLFRKLHKTVSVFRGMVAAGGSEYIRPRQTTGLELKPRWKE